MILGCGVMYVYKFKVKLQQILDSDFSIQVAKSLLDIRLTCLLYSVQL